MGPAAEALAHFVGDGAHVGSRGYACAKAGAAAFDREDEEFFDFDLHCFQHYLLLFSCQLVGGDALNFFGGERWRDLLDNAEKFGAERLQFV